MAYDGRRAMLTGLDVNHNAIGGANMSHHSGAQKAAARSSMIPRHSVAAQAQAVGSASMMRNHGLSRSSMTPAAAAAAASAAMDAENWASHSSVHNTPHRFSVSSYTPATGAGPSRRNEASTSRQSMAPASAAMPDSKSSAGRMSMQPQVAQTPNHSRKSISAGRHSLAPNRAGAVGGAKSAFADPRPIREDKAYLTRMEMEIQEFLSQTGFTFPQKYSGEFHMPSQALVMSAFRHLYHQCVDLRYTFVAEPKKEVEEVIQVLSDIKYPLIMEMSKTKLSAPGSIHNWPPVCGMLHWLVCLETSMEPVKTKYHGGPLERPVSDDDEDFCHYFPYLWRCYEQFWQSKDDYPEEEAKLEKIFEDKSQRARADVVRIRAELHDAQERLRELEENDSPFEVEMKEKQVLESDVKKFIEYRDTVLLPRIRQYRSILEKLRTDSQSHVEAIETRTKERDRLRRDVDAQDVSADDFESMSREREALSKQLEELMNKLLDRSAANGHSEISLSNKQARVEDDLKSLSDRCREIDMFPYVNEGEQFFDFEMHAGNAATMLPKGLDIRHDVKQRIREKREWMKRQRRETSSVKLRDQESYDLLLEDVEEKRQTYERLELRFKSVREQTNLASTASKEENRIQAELEAKRELAIAQIDQQGRTALDQAEARVQVAQMQLNLVRERDASVRKELHREFVVGLETILSLKSTVSEGLQALQEAAEQGAL